MFSEKIEKQYKAINLLNKEKIMVVYSNLVERELSFSKSITVGEMIDAFNTLKKANMTPKIRFANNNFILEL